jgi:hypothetical protein
MLGALAVRAARPLELANESFHVTLTAGPQAVSLDSLTLAGIEDSLVFANAGEGSLRSGTGLLPQGGVWHFSRLPWSGSASANGSKLRVSGIQLGPESEHIVRENWELTRSGDTLTWRIDRESLRDGRLSADRFPAIVIRTVEQNRFLQISHCCGYPNTSHERPCII